MDEAAIDKLIALAQQPTEGLDQVYQQMLAVTGAAEDSEKLVRVECTAEGVTGLDIDPRALRWGSRRLAEVIKWLIAEGLDDLQKKSAALLSQALGADALDLSAHGDTAELRLRATQEIYEQAMDSALAELASIERRLASQPGSGGVR
ncbi:hypothetical protein [Nonomuraea recticatena]|uniref:YbaB/EbfC DNA-binding family protein n=1 Tax=Nonomuraea recticatena TaxID=46178 RepID=A0ABP6FNQ8_9ACTN